jgi:hypothetical protein
MHIIKKSLIDKFMRAKREAKYIMRKQMHNRPIASRESKRLHYLTELKESVKTDLNHCMAAYDYMNDMLRGNWEETTLSRAFFSIDNIKALQNSIRREVNERSGPKNYVIDDQSIDELKIIMRGMYYQYARNLESNIKDQVEDLNKKVIDWSSPHILSAVDHYYYYINDISHLPVPMQQPQNISRAGTKSLPYNPYM